MSYLFDPDNWEWLWTGNNFRFLLEGFAINLEIAAIGIVLSLVLGLLLALMRISSGMDRIPQKDLRAQSELAAFYIFPPGAGKALGSLFSTHPPMEKRIAALERLERQLQGVAA